VKVIKEYGGPGSITHFLNMIKKELKLKNPGIDMSKATPDQMKEAKKTIRKKTFLHSCSMGQIDRSMVS
jgi:hypothetical protein